MENFTFPYCPRPNYYADQIIEARQRYARSLEEAIADPVVGQDTSLKDPSLVTG